MLLQNLFMPEQASTIAGEVDAGYFYLWAVTIFFTAVVYILLFVAAIKYRRRHPDEIPRPQAGSIKLEIAVNTFITAVFLSTFFVGAILFYRLYQVPADTALDIHVVGKQWMWQFQHPTGEREINELHVPIHTKIKLVATTEDVIHSLFFPTFRTKSDVVPGRFTNMWFEATLEGTFPLYCTEFCGLSHSGMNGRVIVMKQTAYQEWLAGNRNQVSPIEAGRVLFERSGCTSCHGASGEGVRCPTLVNLYGAQQRLQDGTTIVADEAYLRESIIQPQAKLVAGYANIMPTYQGQLNEEQLLQLVSYIKSLAPGRSNAIESTAPARSNNPQMNPLTVEGQGAKGPDSFRANPVGITGPNDIRNAQGQGQGQGQQGGGNRRPEKQ